MTRLGLALALVTTSGCQTLFGLEAPQRIDAGSAPHDDGIPVDAGPDAQDAFVAPDGVTCYGTGLVVICPTSTISPVNVQIDGTLDTSTDPRCLPEFGAYCVIAGRDVKVNDVDVTGARPLVLLATPNNVRIDGELLANSQRILDAGGMVVGERIGPGEGTVAQCGTPNVGGTATSAGGGGAGGTFGGRGGNGATGANGGGGAGGDALAVGGAPTTLRGGCPGAKGGNNTGGAAGHGGGAVYLISTNQITIAGGFINVGGEGGFGGTSSGAGGGGGGSGGFIGLDAPTISCTGALAANGGGGGEGSDLNSNDGSVGASSVSATTQAAGGTGGSFGGAGGPGSFQTTLIGGDGVTSNSGAGGGGGGAGIIKVFSNSTLGGCTVSPPAT